MRKTVDNMRAFLSIGEEIKQNYDTLYKKVVKKLGS